MNNENSFDSEINKAVSQINKNATEGAPESNWISVLSRSENEKPNKGILLFTSNYKLVSAAASILLVVLVGSLLVFTLSDGRSKTVKTTDTTTTTSKDNEPTTTGSVVPLEESTVPTAGTNQPATTKPKTVATTPVTIPARPGNPSGLQLVSAEEFGGPADPGNYNVFFSWNASPSTNVKYCVTTNAEGAAHDNSCSWNKPYIYADTSRGFGLVFKKNTTYQFKVTAVDQYDQKSDTVSLDWQLP